MIDPVQLDCPRCSEYWEYDEAQIWPGMTIECAHCQQVYRVAFAPQDEPEDAENGESES